MMESWAPGSEPAAGSLFSGKLSSCHKIYFTPHEVLGGCKVSVGMWSTLQTSHGIPTRGIWRQDCISRETAKQTLLPSKLISQGGAPFWYKSMLASLSFCSTSQCHADTAMWPGATHQCCLISSSKNWWCSPAASRNSHCETELADICKAFKGVS